MAARFKALMTVLNVLSCVGVTIRNDVARLAVDGSYVDAHDGMVLEHEGTYFLYGEAYGNQTLGTPYPWTDWPRLAVYTSPDMVSWTYRGPVLERSQVGGTLWIPNVIYHPPSNRFIMWFGAGGWGTATSTDGIHFEPAVLNQYSRFGPAAGTDGTGVFIDDDGAGYIIFSSSPPGFDHIVSIERLSDDLLTSTNVKVADVFPDRYVESPSLFKHNGHYYATYGSCCCGCNEGSGLVVFTASSVHGPWVRQHPHGDVNCRDASADACGGYGKRSGNLNDLVYHAQWWGPSFIPVVRENNTLSIAVLFSGRRWLSGPNVPAGCNDICGNKGKPDLCLNGGGAYQLRTDLSVWYPLEFDPTSGAVLPLKPLPSFELHLPGDPPGPPPPPGPTPLKLVRVYRCQKPGPDHFASLDPGCEGQQSEGTYGCISAVDSIPDIQPFYRCTTSKGMHFSSVDPGCEGEHQEAMLGYIFMATRTGVTTQLFRCQNSGSDLFDSTDPHCEGFPVVKALGYVSWGCSVSLPVGSEDTFVRT